MPAQIAKLSDIEGGPVQEALKKASREIYCETELPSSIQPSVSAIWDLLPEAKSTVNVDLSSLHWFDVTNEYIDYRRVAISRTLEFCEAISTGSPLPKRGRISTRYYEGLPLVDPERVTAVAQLVSSFMVG